MTREEALYKYALRLGDNALIMSHRLSEWCSNAPFLEEDLALTNFALDMIGRAQALLKYAGELEGKGNDEDKLAYRRSERQYFNYLITELPNGDFGYTMARQLFLSAFEKFFFTELTQSKDEILAAIAAKTLKEVKYHLTHSEDWVIRLGDGTKESHDIMQAAIDKLWMYTGELFEMDETDELLAAEGIAINTEGIKPMWRDYIKGVLNEATLVMPEDGYMQTGCRKGIHTEHLGHLLSEMQYLQNAYPDAQW